MTAKERETRHRMYAEEVARRNRLRIAAITGREPPPEPAMATQIAATTPARASRRGG